MSDTPQKMSKRRQGKEESCNVKVVVRCRPMSDKEKTENQLCAVFPKPQAGEITVHESKKSEKVFTFDTVYNALSTQEEIFNSQIEPIVDEVLSGFNCTVFAYGQTGTGKTYTMEGEWSDDPKCPSAGMVPRVISSIFQKLQEVREYSVKISFLELYNEELTDLMDVDPDKKLRIFTDATTKGGCMVSNLEETHVKNAQETFNLVQKCTEKRRTAATWMNENSSRSHTIFTLTVYSKDTNNVGEDVIKTGKLHLVDLAGSESIGRSGAKDARAKEAGNINKSLLTLGRVISALVDKSGYVPYRDSKLTRLLRESLGGSAKTCIIATVSPASGSMEETLSTLSYANQAKNIKNKPQVNQKMTHKAYMTELLSQISILKRENEVLRTKNGIILPPETYEELVRGNKSKSSQLEELELTLKVKVAEFEELKTLFTQKEEELATTQELKQQVETALAETSAELALTKEELEITRVHLEETKYLVSEHEKTEEVIVGKANELTSTLETVISDKNKLHEKIYRKTSVEQHNKQTSSAFKNILSEQASKTQAHEQEFLATQAGAEQSLQKEVTSFNSDHENSCGALQESLSQIDSQVKRTTQQATAMHTNQMVTFADTATKSWNSQTQWHEAASQKVETTTAATVSIAKAAKAQLEQQHAKVQEWSAQMQAQANTSFAENSTYCAASTQSVEKAAHMVAAASDHNCQELTSAKNHFESFLDQSRQRLQSCVAASKQHVATAFIGQAKSTDQHVAKADSAATVFFEAQRQISESNIARTQQHVEDFFADQQKRSETQLMKTQEHVQTFLASQEKRTKDKIDSMLSGITNMFATFMKEEQMERNETFSHLQAVVQQNIQQEQAKRAEAVASMQQMIKAAIEQEQQQRSQALSDMKEFMAAAKKSDQEYRNQVQAEHDRILEAAHAQETKAQDTARGVAADQTSAAIEASESCSKSMQEMSNHMISHNAAWLARAEEIKSKTTTIIDDANKNNEVAHASIVNTVDKIESTVVQTSQQAIAEHARVKESLKVMVQSAQEGADSMREAFDNQAEKNLNEFTLQTKHHAELIVKLSETTKAAAQEWTAQLEKQQAALANQRQFSSEQHTEVQAKLARFVEQELKDDLPTGTTPQKKEFMYPKSIPRTEDHEQLLTKYRLMPKPMPQLTEDAADEAKETSSETASAIGSVDVEEVQLDMQETENQSPRSTVSSQAEVMESAAELLEVASQPTGASNPSKLQRKTHSRTSSRSSVKSSKIAQKGSKLRAPAPVKRDAVFGDATNVVSQ